MSILLLLRRTHRCFPAEIISASGNLTELGREISQLPDFGSLAIATCVVAAMNQYNCGHELIVLSSILSVLNVAPKLSTLPKSMQSSDGDFMILIQVINAVLAERNSFAPGAITFQRICQKLGLMSIEHFVKRALRRYDALMEQIENLPAATRDKALQTSTDWSCIARSLLCGYADHVFVSMKDLYGRSHRYVRYQSTGAEYAVLDHKSVLYAKKKEEPVPIILARDIHHSTSIRERAIVAFLGRLQPDWITSPVTRTLPIHDAELQKCNTDGIFNRIQQTYAQVRITPNANNVLLDGPFNEVYHAELMILRGLVTNNKIQFENGFPPTATDDHLRMKQNLELVSKMRHIFHPMQWRWKNEAQVDMAVALSNAAGAQRTCEVSIDARHRDYGIVRDELTAFTGWLKQSAVVRHPDHGKR